MKGLFFALALAATAALLWQSVTPARACSVGPDFDPIRDSEIIVAGRMTGWEIIEGATRETKDPRSYRGDDADYYGPYEPVRFELAVDRVYKGSAPATVEMVAGNTLLNYDGSLVWVGSWGACGAFDEDPTGNYLILGLNADSFGRYRPSLFQVFYFGSEPAGEKYNAAVARIEASLPDLPTLPLAVAAVAIPVVFVLTASFVFPAKGSRG